MDKVKIKLKSSFKDEYKEFDILSRESLIELINNLDKTKIASDMINLAKGTNQEGTFYAEIDAEDEDGDIDIYWLKKGDSPIYMYNKYITLLELPTGSKSPLSITNRNILLPHMLELYNSILESEHISLDESEVFKIVLDFFKTSKNELIKKHEKNIVSKIASSFDNRFICKQLDNLYSNIVD